MTDAPTLFPLVPIPADLTIEERFDAFHQANPHVYDALVQRTRALVAMGRTRVSMKMLYEVLRFDYQMTTTDPTSDYKLNNSYTSRYARLIMQQESDLAGVYETRCLHT